MVASPALRSLTLAGLAAAVVAAGLYIFGSQHTPDYSTSLFGQSGQDTLSLKSWLATGVLAFAGIQLGLALWIYGRLPFVAIAPPRVGKSGFLGEWMLSLLGCFLYGVFVAKVLLVHSPGWRVPGWALPLLGGTLVATVAVLWYTSALWYFNDFKLPF